ncbi:MAG: hypothetical protein MJZ34_03175 [Paludibacteraceae bacterium]|nr:hypothetical protein [Paludibacteraceae bacterium]
MKHEIKQAKHILIGAEKLYQNASANYTQLINSYDFSDCEFVQSTMSVGEDLNLIEKDQTMGDWIKVCNELICEYGKSIDFLDLTVMNFIEFLLWKSVFNICNDHDDWSKIQKLNYINEKFENFTGDCFKAPLANIGAKLDHDAELSLKDLTMLK